MSMSKEEQKAAKAVAKELQAQEKAAAKEQQVQERARQNEERRVATADKQGSCRNKSGEEPSQGRKEGINTEGAIMVAYSYDDSRDQFLILFPDRVEHVKRGETMSLLRSGAGPRRSLSSESRLLRARTPGIYHIVEVHTSGNSIKFKADVVQGPAILAATLEQMSVGKVAPALATAPTEDVHDQLRKLAALHADGILTDDEFASKKSKSSWIACSVVAVWRLWLWSARRPQEAPEPPLSVIESAPAPCRSDPHVLLTLFTAISPSIPVISLPYIC